MNSALRIWQDRAFFAAAWALGLVGFILPLAMVTFLLWRGSEAVSWSLLWDSPKGFPLGNSGGIRPAIEGSLALLALGLTVALPFGVGGAVYLTEYGGPPAIKRAVTFISACLAGVPAIVYGLFGYAFLVVSLMLKTSLLAGGITLGLLMLPMVLLGACEAISAIDGQYRNAALSLGVSRFYAFRRTVWPKARPGVLAVIALAAGHAIGSAAPILLTASVILSKGGLVLSSPVMTLPTHLYYLVSEASSLDQAYGTALILVTLLLIVNFFVMMMKGPRER